MFGQDADIPFSMKVKEIFEIFTFHNERRTMSPTELHTIGHLPKKKVDVG